MYATAADRTEFLPPPPPGRLKALGIALLAHALLLAALTWGVNWRSDRATPAVEAELWSNIPQQAAPKLVETPPPEPEPAPPPKPAPPKVDPGPSDAEIALAREKKRKLEEKLEQERIEKEKLAQKKREQEQRDKEKREQAKKLAEEKRKKELEAKRQEQLKEERQAKEREKLRQENLRRMAGLAGASGSPSATGTALKSAGPSATYAGRIVGRVRPNIVFTEDIVGNPSAEVEVRCAPDGTIVGTRLVKGSGSKSWDEAVIKALIKTETLPRDTDGRVPSTMIISFRPRD